MTNKELLSKPGLYVITDINLAGGRSYEETIQAVLVGGARIIQIRDRVTPFDDLLLIGKRLKGIIGEFNGLLIIERNPYLAREIDADGVHLGQNDMPIDIAREIMGKDKIIGLSTHDFFQMLKGVGTRDVDYVTIGPIFRTDKETEYPTLGVPILEWAMENLNFPMVATGGITPDNIYKVLEKGVKLIGVLSAVMTSTDIVAATRNLNDIILNAHKS